MSDIIAQLLAVISNPVADLELGFAAVEFAVAIEAFIKRNHFHLCIHCIATVLAVGLAICALKALH